LKRLPLRKPLIDDLVATIVRDPSATPYIAAFLMVVCKKGMVDDDVTQLTLSMASSGSIFDYRSEPALAGVRLVRRYPTGALSEKTALILPAIIATARKIVRVCSPFLVARSLGYTGGTWDKLSAIPGFRFPLPGKETIALLDQCGVAMTVTQGDANPADRILYAMRSATGTVESHPLIISSIASKHICFPVDRLLMDVRYGEGAFLETEIEARQLGEKLAAVLNKNQVPTDFELTPTTQPTGSAIGNAVEVAEAISVLKQSVGAPWNSTAICEQTEVVLHFFGLLMSREFRDKSYEQWVSFGREQLTTGAALVAFADILNAHGVARRNITELIDDPIAKLFADMRTTDIRPNATGRLITIDQRRLGQIVNEALGAGGNDYGGDFTPRNGLILFPRLGDSVSADVPICRLYTEDSVNLATVELLLSCFEVK
jgi:thymidine phosphorylase